MSRITSRTPMTRYAAAAAGLALVFIAACDSETTAPVIVATSNVTAPVTASTVAVAAGQTFSLPSGAALSPALANQPVTLRFTQVGAATTAAITVPTGTVNTTVTFGSCIFTVVAPGLLPNFAPGATITVATCAITVNTAGTPANGTTSTVPMTLNLGGTVSIPVSIPVTVSTGGQVTVGTGGGTVTVGTTTTATGTGS